MCNAAYNKIGMWREEPLYQVPEWCAPHKSETLIWNDIAFMPTSMNLFSHFDEDIHKSYSQQHICVLSSIYSEEVYFLPLIFKDSCL